MPPSWPTKPTQNGSSNPITCEIRCQFLKHPLKFRFQNNPEPPVGSWPGTMSSCPRRTLDPHACAPAAGTSGQVAATSSTSSHKNWCRVLRTGDWSPSWKPWRARWQRARWTAGPGNGPSGSRSVWPVTWWEPGANRMSRICLDCGKNYFYFFNFININIISLCFHGWMV